MDSLQTVWGWQPALYLFLGGVGAGAFVASGALSLLWPEGNRRAIRNAMWAAVACLAVGLLLLVSELVFPLRGLMMWQSFTNVGSWMTIGAWLLFAAFVFFVLAAALRTEPLTRRFAREGGSPASSGACRAVTVVGMALAVGVAAYTGILLMSAPGVPLWNTALLPLLFTVSALDTGIALVELCCAAAKGEQAASGAARLLSRSAVALIVVEAAVLALFVGSALSGGGAATARELAAAASAQLLTSGGLSAAFWGLVVAVGLAAPLVANLYAAIVDKRAASDAPAASGKGAAPDAWPTAPAASSAATPPRTAHALTLAGAICALVGGCALRFVVLFAGMHADGFIDTLSAFLN